MKAKVIALASEAMGEGDHELGRRLMVNFLKLVAQGAEKPEAIFCYNGGVKLLAAGSEALPILEVLVGQGVPVWACKTCLDHFQIEPAVGTAATMGDFVELASQFAVVRP